MRIIAGQARGLRLLSPKGMETRPMLDRVKAALFSILGEAIEEAVVLDLFAGSGALGLEALSRGARHCTFVEQSRQTQTVLRGNLEKSRFLSRGLILGCDAYRIFPHLQGTEPFTLIFVDPPYVHLDHPLTRTQTLQFMASLASAVLSPMGRLVLHYRRQAMAGVPLPAPLVCRDQRVYGSTELMILGVADARFPRNE